MHRRCPGYLTQKCAKDAKSVEFLPPFVNFRVKQLMLCETHTGLCKRLHA